MEPRILDRRPELDPRNRNYPVRAAIRRAPWRTKVFWRPGAILDQGREGACVGYGWTAEALSSPVRADLRKIRNSPPRDATVFARTVYTIARTLDPWPGENYEGTSVLAGAKVMQQYGLIRTYRWAFGLQDTIDSILTIGPAVLGINWYDGMYYTRGDRLEVSGRLVGGHCLLALGYDPKQGIRLQNSWGTGWGDNGLAWISEADLDKLLHEDGESCVPTGRSYGR